VSSLALSPSNHRQLQRSGFHGEAPSSCPDPSRSAASHATGAKKGRGINPRLNHKSQTPAKRKLYFTTSVKKFGCVVVCPFNVAVNEIKYVPGGVACPVGLFGRLAHDPAPSATTASNANVNANRRDRRNINATPPIINETSSTPIPPPNPRPPGWNPVCVTVVPWQKVCNCTACSAPPGHTTVFGIKFTLMSGEEEVAVKVTVPVCPGAQVMINP